MDIFDSFESEVRSYCRNWDTVFDSATGSFLHCGDGRMYLDFFARAGALNYGHNNPALLRPLIDYLLSDAVVHCLNMKTPAKQRFLKTFQELKLARTVTGQSHIVRFTNAFHSMTLGSLSVTGNPVKRHGAGVPLTNTPTMPYDGCLDEQDGALRWLRQALVDPGSGLDTPAAVIVDDVQAGCGRIGTFFSFEEAGITPDIVCLSKSISVFGLPVALTLFRPDLALWSPGEHNGTFRGHNPAFVTATAALVEYWQDGRFVAAVGGLAEQRIATESFTRGLLVETSGPRSEVVKTMPALTTSPGDLQRGLGILADAAEYVKGEPVTLTPVA